MSRKKAALDKAAEKLVSRKLAAWLVATVLLVLGHVDADAWVALTGVYVGVEGAQNVIGAILSARGHRPTDRE